MSITDGEGESSFEARLAKYGLRRDEVNAEALRVTTQSKVRLHTGGRGITRPRVLQPSSPSQMKEWIGVPQSAVVKNARAFVGRQAGTRLPPNLHELSAEPEHRRGRIDPRLKPHRLTIHEVTRQYVYGDAGDLTALEPLIGRTVAVEFPFWFFRRVHVDSGGVLEFGRGLNSLVTDTLIIENGGEIRSAGSLTINCRRIARS